MPKKPDLPPTGDKKENKTGRGGKRKGAGVKPKGTAARVNLWIRVDPEALRRLNAEANRRRCSSSDVVSDYGMTLPPA